jgi:hypothetical protein
MTLLVLITDTHFLPPEKSTFIHFYSVMTATDDDAQMLAADISYVRASVVSSGFITCDLL